MQTDASSQDELLQAQGDFQNYHRFLIMATDLASIDPLDAMRHAFSASQAHVKVAEHLHSIANTIALEIMQHNQENAQAFKTQAVHTGVLGAVMMAAVLLLWLLISERVTRRLSRLSEALSAFEQNDTNPPTLPMVRRLSQQKKQPAARHGGVGAGVSRQHHGAPTSPVRPGRAHEGAVLPV